MPGSTTRQHALPQPLELGLRTFLASALVLGVFHFCQRPIVEPMIPVFHSAIRLLATEFTITSAEIAKEGPNETVRFRANLSSPVDYAGHMLYPFGWNGVPNGGFQITRTLGSVLEYSALLLIVILAWPAPRAWEIGVRLALAVPLMALLILIDVPFTVVADLWSLLRDEFDPHGFCGWQVWSRFLMGGGGLLLACVMAAVAIAVARRSAEPRRPRIRSETGYAQLVLPRRSNDR
jgi:hypothetical protein